MARSKKTVSKKETKKAETTVEARPQYEGKDPLAEGNTLHNPTNSEAETHYKVTETSEAVSQIGGQDASERAEQHNAEAVSAPSGDATEQEEVAAERVEPGTEQVDTV